MTNGSPKRKLLPLKLKSPEKLLKAVVIKPKPSQLKRSQLRKNQQLIRRLRKSQQLIKNQLKQSQWRKNQPLTKSQLRKSQLPKLNQ